MLGATDCFPAQRRCRHGEDWESPFSTQPFLAHFPSSPTTFSRPRRLSQTCSRTLIFQQAYNSHRSATRFCPLQRQPIADCMRLGVCRDRGNPRRPTWSISWRNGSHCRTSKDQSWSFQGVLIQKSSLDIFLTARQQRECLQPLMHHSESMLQWP